MDFTKDKHLSSKGRNRRYNQQARSKHGYEQNYKVAEASKGIVVNHSYDFLFEKENEENDKRYADYI